MLVSLGGPIEDGVMQNILASPKLKVRVSHELEHGLSCNRRSRLHHTDGLGRGVEESTKASVLGNLGFVVLTSLINSKYMIRYLPNELRFDHSVGSQWFTHGLLEGASSRPENNIVSRTFPCNNQTQCEVPHCCVRQESHAGTKRRRNHSKESVTHSSW